MAKYTQQQIKEQIKPLSNNVFVAFFQRVYRAWLAIWYGFCDKNPKLAPVIYQVFFFIVFSMGVTIWQYIVMTFLPYAFASLNNGPWGWPSVPIQSAGGNEYIIIGDVQGLGYFIAFEIAVFTAQCINFPLQRNITYRSHGNPWYQAMWYFIGWVLVSIATNAVWGILNCYFVYWNLADAVTGLIKTMLTGGVSMAIFFFIFLVIFPDNNKVAKSAKAKYEKLIAENAPAEDIAKAESECKLAEVKALLTNTEKAEATAISQASAKAIKYLSLIENNKVEVSAETLQASFEEVCAAIEAKEKAVEARAQALEVAAPYGLTK